VGTDDATVRNIRAVVFLAGKDSAFINGIEVFVDGGVTQN
jgi:hypothetical protein